MDNNLKNDQDIDLEYSDAQKVDFCKEWPCAKRALELLRDIIKNPIVKGVLQVIIEAGDKICGKICNI